MTVFHLTFHCVNEPTEYKYSYSFLVFIIGHILANYKVITSAFNVMCKMYFIWSHLMKIMILVAFFLYEFDMNMSGDYI